MPIYEYSCRKCGAHVEVLQKISDKPLTKCRECNGRLEKEWSPAGLQFKGSGWYVTDYARKGAGAADEKAAPESKSEGKPEGKSEVKSDGKSESKSEAKTESAAGGETKKTSKTKATSKGASTD